MVKETLTKVMVIGSGGREHASVSAFLRSNAVEKLYVAPGNDGMFHGGDVDPRLERIPMRIKSPDDFKKLVPIAHDLGVGLVFVGPEKPLSLGIVDEFKKEGLAIVGPTRQASLLEGSKALAKDIMFSLGIPVPDYRHFDNPEDAESYIRACNYPVVVKADGLAAGKGSLVTNDHADALAAVKAIMIDRKFGDAGNQVVIERRLDGEEFSFFAFTDGETVLPMAWARDYKRVFDNNEGSNTGGMGGYSPYREEEADLTQKVMGEIALPLIYGCREKYDFVYKGILYIGGTFLPENGKINPYVFEINVRMGDPEAQVIYPRIQTDLLGISMGIIEENLAGLGTLDWDPRYHVCICATSGRTKGRKGWYKGYPGRYGVGKEIRGLDHLSSGTLVFHSGTRWIPERNLFVTDGGRVLSVVSSAFTLDDAKKEVYREMDKIIFEGIHYGSDIADR